ncbi:uncharacterized protein [Argopecten irradians]|uniref:uncharacterized protein n=1 Tax=Argopecten irradians TaxID=31199 RepID=UPI003723D088
MILFYITIITHTFILFSIEVVEVVLSASSPKYVWPVCSKSYNYEVESGGQSVLPIAAEDYQFVGLHPVIPCNPISFDGTAFTHMDLLVGTDSDFHKLSISVFIQPSVAIGTVFHYQSDDNLQNIILTIENSFVKVSHTFDGFSLDLMATTSWSWDDTQWYLVAYVQYDGGYDPYVFVTDGTLEAQDQYIGSVPTPLNIPGKLRIGSKFDFSGTNFEGEMICLSMYDSELVPQEYTDSEKSCVGVSFPASSELPTRAPPCDVTLHKERNSTHFSSLHNATLKASITHTTERNGTTLAICASLCVARRECVSFTFTKVIEETNTCRLFDVYDLSYVVVDLASNLYVLHLCKYL